MTERFTPGPVDVYTSYEHWHRYLWVLSRAKDRTVLDLACGSGYGSYLLSRVARSVRGVDRDEASIAEARQRFVRENLTYEVGDAEAYRGDPVDLIVSFETIEHLETPEKLLDVIRQNLLPDGIALISTPNRKTYSDETGYVNPFHTREFDIEEFLTMLGRHFPTVIPYGQRLVTGSLISSIEGERFRRGTVAVEPVTFDGEGALESTAGSGPSPTYQLVEVSLAPGKVLPRSGSVLLDRDALLWTQLARGTAGSTSLAGELQKQIENILLVQGQMISLEAAMHTLQTQQVSAASLAPEVQKQIAISLALQGRLASLEGSLAALREHELAPIREELQRRIEAGAEQREAWNALASEIRPVAAGASAVAAELQKQIGERLRMEQDLEQARRMAEEARRMAEESEQRASALESRLQILENARPPRPAVDLSSEPTRDRAERLVHALQVMIEDVAADNRDLHRQVDALVSGLQEAGASFPRPARREDPVAAPLPVRLARRLPRPVRGLLVRGRNALTGKRPPAAPAGAPTPQFSRLDLSAVARPPVRTPLLSIVIDPTATRWRKIAREQTLVEREWLLWDPTARRLRVEREDGTLVSEHSAPDAAAVRSAASGVYVVRLDEGIARAPRTWWETAAFVMAGEGLAFLRTPAIEQRPGETSMPPFSMVQKEVWSPESGIDAEALRTQVSRDGRARVAGKDVAGTFAGSSLAPAFELPPIPGFLRPVDLYWVSGPSDAGPVRHEIAAIDQLLSNAVSRDPRPSVLILLSDGPEDEDLFAVLEETELRVLAVSCAPMTPTLQAALERVRELTPHVYALGDALAPQLFFSAVSHLLRGYGVVSILQPGESAWFRDAVRPLRREFPGVRVVAAPRAGSDVRAAAEDSDLILAKTSRQLEDLERSGIPATGLARFPGALPPPVAREPRPSEAESQTVVAWIGDLVPRERPEDFLAIARRFRGDDGFVFHMAGDGPLAPDIDSLIENMGLRNVRRTVGGVRAETVLAGSDVLCATGETLALPRAALQALASGIPVVSPALSDLTGNTDIRPVAAGNISEFESALRSLGTAEARRAAAAEFLSFLGSVPTAAAAARELTRHLLGVATR
ncbi:MAG: methyltransferase domain-containing protein [Acidobacteriota bacterium]